ncbi:MAG TPA: hypothetical protein VKY26_01790 [Actinomycetota bacterium]|nr:hypothetical protein [Actinomycetota bacterium]
MTGNRKVLGGVERDMRLRLVAAVAAAAVVVGACGSTPSTATLQKLPVEASPTGASASATSAAGVDADTPLPGSFGAIEYRLGGPLPPLPDKAPAYDLAAAPAQDDRHRIATALGVADSDRHLFVGVGSTAGSLSFDAACAAPSGVDVSGTGEADQASGFACASPVMNSPSPGTACGAGSTSVCLPGTPPEPVRPADLPSREAATARARALFHSLGVDVSADELHVTDGITQWLVSADPVVGGLPTIGRTISATIGAEGSIVTAGGFLGTPEKLGEYPLVDPATVGFKRLLEAEAHRPRPMIAMGMPCRADVPSCGEPLTPQVRTITGVHVVLQQLSGKLVPAFVFETGPNETAPPVPAVTDDLLQAAAPTVSTMPEPEPATPQPAPGGTPTRP